MVQEVLALSTVGIAVVYTGYSLFRTVYPKKNQTSGCSGCSSAGGCNLTELKKK